MSHVIRKTARERKLVLQVSNESMPLHPNFASLCSLHSTTMYGELDTISWNRPGFRHKKLEKYNTFAEGYLYTVHSAHHLKGSDNNYFNLGISVGKE